MADKKRSTAYQVVVALSILFGLGFLANLWITEHDGGVTYTKVDKRMEKVEVSWSRVQFYAAIGIRDVDKAQNISTRSSDGDDICKVPRLLNDEHPSTVTCRRPDPLKGSCQVAEKIFHSKPVPSCSHQKHYELCKISETANGYAIDCTNDICKSDILIGIVDTLQGSLKWKQIATIQELETQLMGIMATDEDNGNFGFAFLKCGPKYSKNTPTSATQLLLLPRNVTKFACGNDPVCKNGVSVNIIWLDSTSHSHFYRSMPKSVAAFRNVRESGDAYVFNYNLMQSLKGGTYVNTRAFTSGNITSRGTLLKQHIPVGELFNLYKKGGYQVLWMDDLCWHWSLDHCACGIPKFLGIAKEKKKIYYDYYWKKVRANLIKKGVDHIGVSLANCEIMRTNKITDPFKDTRKNIAICYNGEYQTNYLFESMAMLQKQMADVNRPFFHFLDLNLGHEASGRRIQTLDDSLAKFVDFLSHQDNTLTLLFGDHGNKYGAFVKASKEARLEMSHTILFAVASKNLREKLGMDKLDAMEVNQNRMVNIFDLRNTMLRLAPGSIPPEKSVKRDNHPDGLFFPISQNRSCKSMGIPPEAGKCICQQGKIDTSVKNDTEVRLIAEFALGVINNKIQEQFRAANENLHFGFGFCNRLVGRWISNVQRNVIGNLIITDLNIHVPAGSNSSNDEDLFTVVVHEAQGNNGNTTTMELVHYERITTYAAYDTCRDNGVDGDICVCDLDSTSLARKQWHEIPHIVFNQITTVASLDSCLFIYERRTLHGLVVETSCDCGDRRYEIFLQIIKQSNVVSSTKESSMLMIVDSGTMYFMCAFHQFSSLRPWYIDYDVRFRELGV